jgi:hypothetical protein
MKWIVLWTVVNVFSVPCNFPIQENEYGYEQQHTTMLSLNCSKTTEKEMHKIFGDKSVAEEFVKNADKCGEIIFSPCVKDMVIKELK